MNKVIHVIGNGPKGAPLFNKEERKGLKIGCNILPFAIPNIYGTVIADFKMMKAITEGSVTVPGDWILGFRPKVWSEKTPGFLMKFGHQIKEFYLNKPDYAETYTDFNCGHMAVHYSAHKLKGTEIHLYGFDSLFEFDIRSTTDFVLQSDRGAGNTHKLSEKWRHIFNEMFKEFSDTKFVLHHNHGDLKINKSNNIEIIIGK